MIAWAEITLALNGHGQKFVTLGLLHPLCIKGQWAVAEPEWEALARQLRAPERTQPANGLHRLGARVR